MNIVQMVDGHGAIALVEAIALESSMHPRLSARQEQCLRLTAFRTDKEIAVHLGISEATVKKHVHEACQRLGVNRRKAALALLDPIVPEGPATTGETVAGGYPKQPMAASASDAHALSGNGDGRGQADDKQRDATVREAGEGPSGSAHGLVPTRSEYGSGHGHGADGRLGYRVPPRSPLLRFLLTVALIIILAALVMTTVVMLGETHKAVGRIDAASKGG